VRALSGCVTSAETVLIQEQSYEKLQYQLDLSADSRPDIVIAMSPNSIASLSSFLGLPAVECFLRVASVLKDFGARYVVDTFGAGDVALVDARTEFVRRYTIGCR
jgi:iron only hydrogenase large subunit-like protein